MIPLKFNLEHHSAETKYNSFVLPTKEYAKVVWGGTYYYDISKLEMIHINSIRLVEQQLKAIL